MRRGRRVAPAAGALWQPWPVPGGSCCGRSSRGASTARGGHIAPVGSVWKGQAGAGAGSGVVGLSPPHGLSGPEVTATAPCPGGEQGAATAAPVLSPLGALYIRAKSREKAFPCLPSPAAWVLCLRKKTGVRVELLQ